MDKPSFEQAKLFLFTDIRREIELGRASETDPGEVALASIGVPHGGGNFLTGLGLLCYTEFGGKLKYNRKTKKRDDYATDNFNLFFDDLGNGYKAFRAAGHNPYNIFRCGMTHEYNVKRPCTIFMLGTDLPAGVGQSADGRYWICVDQYFFDLRRAFDDLEKHLFP